MSEYWKFSSPKPHAAYSTEYFQRLTFNRACELTFPTIAPQNFILEWTFAEVVPSNAAGTIIRPNDIIPSSTDLLPITRDMESEYQRGSRSVLIKYRIPESGEVVEQLYHFSKVRLEHS